MYAKAIAIMLVHWGHIYNRSEHTHRPQHMWHHMSLCPKEAQLSPSGPQAQNMTPIVAQHFDLVFAIYRHGALHALACRVGGLNED
jgi:hypothetical protein